jgi:hypothetical protein
MANHVIEVHLLTGDNAGQCVFIPCLNIEPTNAQIPFQLCCLQCPLQLSFSMTRNKSQDQSLNHVGLDFRTPIFAHGQFYVAISQATSVDSIKVIWDSELAQPKTKKLVYPEVLLD